jgi:diguanylate cyclase (GGDEF)-like protein
VNQGERAGLVAIVADDEDSGRLLLAASAASVGLTPMAFGNGADALEAAWMHRVGLVLLDVDMPGLDGFAVCRRLRSDPRFAAIPIVMVTGHEDAPAITLAFAAGATDFISKPVNWVLFPRRLEYILRNAAYVGTVAEREFQIRTLVEALPDRLWVVAPDGKLRWSPGISGDGREEAKAGSVHDVSEEWVPQQESARALAAIHETARDGLQRKIDYREPGQGNSDRTYELRFSRRDGGDVVIVRQDTSERTAAADNIEWLAYFDPLTGLPNRQRCIQTAEGFLSQASKSGESVAFIYMDLNGFKRINDTFGHPVGDAVLCIVSRKLAQTLDDSPGSHEHMTLARFGGDEFVILLKGTEARSEAIRIANACQARLKDPITHDGLEFHSTPSIGLAVYPDDGSDVATLLKHADTAMNQAKAAGASSVAVYAPAMSSRLRDWLDLEARLRRAVEQDRLHLHYQPKFRLADNQIEGVEALLRWCDTEYGDIPPARFVPIAEESGLIIDMGSWVVRAACRQIRAWMDRGVRIPVAINVSAKELLHGDPAQVVEAELAAAGIPGSLLEIEITESLLVRDSATVRNALDRIRSLGCKIALDDFGTGYSSLAYITRFPPDRIKIDKSFVRGVDQTSGDAAVANAILSLGESLNLIVTAEGIERDGQLEWLRQRGCDEGQGFLLSRPLAPRDLEGRFLFPQENRDTGKAAGRLSHGRIEIP